MPDVCPSQPLATSELLRNDRSTNSSRARPSAGDCKVMGPFRQASSMRGRGIPFLEDAQFIASFELIRVIRANDAFRERRALMPNGSSWPILLKNSFSGPTLFLREPSVRADIPLRSCTRRTHGCAQRRSRQAAVPSCLTVEAGCNALEFSVRLQEISFSTE